MIIKNSIFAFLLICIFGLLPAMEDKNKKIRLSPASTIRTCLYDNKLRPFVNFSKIDRDLGGKELDILDIALLTEGHVVDFNAHYPFMRELTKVQRPALMKCIYQDSIQDYEDFIESRK